MQARDATLLTLVLIAAVVVITPLAILGTIVIFWLLPLLVLLGLAVAAVEGLRLRKAARRFPCLRCGTILGSAAVKLADKEWRDYLRRLRREHPGVKFHLDRTLDAICPRCGTRYTFSDADRTFHLEAAPPAAQPA